MKKILNNSDCYFCFQPKCVFVRMIEVKTESGLKMMGSQNHISSCVNYPVCPLSVETKKIAPAWIPKIMDKIKV